MASTKLSGGKDQSSRRQGRRGHGGTLKKYLRKSLKPKTSQTAYITTPALTVLPLSHLTSCTSTTSNLYLTNSLATAISDPALYRPLTLQVTIFILLWLLRDASPGNTTPRRSEWGSSLPPDCFDSRASYPHVSVS